MLGSWLVSMHLSLSLLEIGELQYIESYRRSQDRLLETQQPLASISLCFSRMTTRAVFLSSFLPPSTPHGRVSARRNRQRVQPTQKDSSVMAGVQPTQVFAARAVLQSEKPLKPREPYIKMRINMPSLVLRIWCYSYWFPTRSLVYTISPQICSIPIFNQFCHTLYVLFLNGMQVSDR